MPSCIRLWLVSAAGLPLVCVTCLAAQPQALETSLEAIRKDLFYLAGPECEGRGIDTKGIEKAAAYIAESFKASGLRPAMPDGTFYQSFRVTLGAKLGSPNKLILQGPNEEVYDLNIGKDATPMGFSRTSKGAGELAFVGYGLSAPRLEYDDYAGIDVKGKFVILIRRTPRPEKLAAERFDPSVPEGEESPLAALQFKVDNAAKHQAAGVIIVSDRVSSARRDDLFSFAIHAQGTVPVSIPVFHMKREVLDKLLKRAGKPALEVIEDRIDKELKPFSFSLAGWSAEGEVTANRTEVICKNVIGVLDGHGPLANETVVIGAHYDHLGYGTFGSLGGPNANGKIHYGADDNASGTAGLLEIARRFGAINNRQGRRIVFIAFSGEERGLYGSMHYCKEPLFPLESTIAMINMDMIGRVTQVPADWLGLFPQKKKDRLVIYGTGTGHTFNSLVDLANQRFDFKLYRVPGGNAPSDSDSFYRKKIPVLFLFSGTHPDYHKPTDLPEKINLQGLKKAADMSAFLLEQLADGPRPQFQATRGGWEDPTDNRPKMRTGPKIGIMPGNYEEEDRGVLVGGVSPGGPAEKAGIKENDLIIEVAGKPVKNIGQYMAIMASQKTGQALEVKVLRAGKTITLIVTPQ